MILSCPSCSKRFMLDGRLLGAGRRVKCGNCSHIWFAEPTMAEAPPAPRQVRPAPQRPAAPVAAPLATVERPGAGGGAAPSRPAARNAAPPPPPPPPPVMEEQRGTLFDDPPDDDALDFEGASRGGMDAGFDATRFDAGADDMGLGQPYKPRPMPKGSNLPAIPGQGKARRAVAAAWAGLVLIVGGIGAGLFYGQETIIQAWPAAFPLYEMAGLAELPGTGLSEPGDPKTTKVEIRDVEGINMLVVSGEIANKSDGQRDVPDIQAVAIGEDGKELYAWRIVPPVRRLFPNQSTKFESRRPENQATPAKGISFRYVSPDKPAAH